MELYTHTHIETEPFHPHPLMRNPHTQTITGARARSTGGITFRRQRVELPDGDFIDVDFADVDDVPWSVLGEHKPIIMLIHGLEGNARSGPACGIYRYLSHRGVRCLGMNLRSCSGELNRTGRLYHAGETEDLAFIHTWLQQQFPNTPLGLVGISLGANILLKYLGENGDALRERVAAAVAISPPFDLLKGAAVMKKGTGLLYTQHMLRPLKAKVRGLEPLIADKVDMSLLNGTNDFEAFDDAFTAPLHGFRGATEYYTTTSSKNFLEGIRVPTLLLRSVDDPFFDPTDIPYQQVEQHPHLYSGFTRYGGHVGFVEGLVPGRYTFWAERQAARFLALVV